MSRPGEQDDDSHDGGTESVSSELERALDRFVAWVEARNDDTEPAHGNGPREGSRIGPYLLERELGRGGQGIVYLARDTRLDRMVALKRLHASAVERSHRAALRLEREALLTARLDDPGICAVYDVGVDAGSPYFVMRHVEGRTLAALLHDAARDGLPVEQLRLPGVPGHGAEALLRFFAQTARTLQNAHDRGIVHRDVKPGNLMCTPEGRCVILDFGLARTDQGEGSLTHSLDVIGTPAYMSPEQVRGGRTLDARTDVYSLGASIYEAFTGRRPFETTTHAETYHAIVHTDPMAPRRLAPWMSREANRVIQTALQKDPAHRYRSAALLAKDLEALADRRPVRVQPVSWPRRAVRRIRRRPLQSALFALLIVSAALTGALVTNWDNLVVGSRERRRRELHGHVEQGFGRLAQSDPVAAQGAFARALELEPDHPIALAGIATALIQSGAPEQALDVLDTHRTAREHVPALAWIQVDALRNMGHEDEAKRLEASLEPPLTPEGSYLLGFRALARAEAWQPDAKRDALDLLTQACIGTDRRQEYMLYALAGAVYLNAREDLGRTVARMLLEGEPSGLDCYFAGVATMAFDARSAVELFSRSIEGDPHYGAFNNRALARATTGDTQGAIHDYEEAIRQNPRCVTAHHGLGHLLNDQERYEEALAAYRRALEHGLDHGKLHLGIARAHHSLGQLAEAWPHARVALQAFPNDPHTAFTGGLILAGLGRGAQAAELLRQAGALGFPGPEPALNLGYLLGLRRSFDEGTAILSDVRDRHPEDERIQLITQYLLFWILVQRGL